MTGKARILVVDDERSMQEFLDIFFRSEGYDVVTAGDLSSALLHLEGDEFDVAVTDIKMPGGSGIDLLRAVREESPETVVIMMTAYASAETAIAAIKEGAYDYITKPFKVDEIRIVVEKALEKKLLASENRRLRSELRSRTRDRSIVGNSSAMQRVFDLVAQVVQIHHRLGDAGGGQVIQGPIQHGLAADLDQWLGHAIGHGPHALAAPRRPTAARARPWIRKNTPRCTTWKTPIGGSRAANTSWCAF